MYTTEGHCVFIFEYWNEICEELTRKNCRCRVHFHKFRVNFERFEVDWRADAVAQLGRILQFYI